MSYAAVVYFDGHRYVGTTMRTHAPYDGGAEDARLPAELTSAPWVQWRMSS